MRVYYYHHIDAQKIHNQWLAGEMPSHLLYGACHLPDHGIDVIYHHPKFLRHRLLLSVHTMIKLLINYRKYDAVYATAFRGLELVVFLRALKLFHKPIVCWHHQPVVKAKSAIREKAARLFYKGFDELLFFSQKIIDESMKSVKAPRGHMHIVHWGPDLHFYDKIKASAKGSKDRIFISTGKELRDMPTLVAAFNKTGKPVDIYICRKSNTINYEQIFNGLKKNNNVRIHYVSGDILKDLSIKVENSYSVVICSLPSNYTVGLTTIVEAIALGKPMICSRNPQLPFNIQEEGCGITPDYYDINGWAEAIDFVYGHPEEAEAMGRKGRLLAERKFNDINCAYEVSKIIKSTLS